MAFASKEEALERATELALDGKTPTTLEVQEMLAAGADWTQVYNLLKDVFYNGEELEELGLSEDAESE